MGSNVLKVYQLLSPLFTNKMTVKLDMFGSLMEDWICSYVHCCNVVTVYNDWSLL